MPSLKPLLSQAKIDARVRQLGRILTRAYRGQNPLFLGVMNGALFFLADLVRAVEIESLEITTLRLGSYAGTASTALRGLEALADTVAGRQILIVDDILDTGQTLAALSQRLRELGAAEVRICVLLEKRRRRDIALRADWVAFKIADKFVVGYGLDFNGKYRALKEVCVLDFRYPEGVSIV